ncbi:MAG: DUF4134 domain-containing protein [Arcicella sp.]|jgi:hypothetical protein|nr:DUF4134 domain-containing protein [Arcicella sp.]
MKQLVKNTQGQRFLALSLLFLVIAGVVALDAPKMFSIIRVILIAFVGIIGAVKVHKKLKSGASDIQAMAMTWFGSFLILLMGNTLMQHIQQLF